MPVLEFRPEGIYCSQGDFYIDPWRPVDKALITHGHADHARFGSKKYLCTDIAAPVIRHRLGNVVIETIPYEKELSLNGVNVSFYPAGHVPGSAQILIEIKGERWVVSGDYKVVDDGLSTPFKPIKCHSFISECTFGLPAFNWLPQEQVFKEINSWWHQCISDGLTPILAAYGLGKAQRLIAGLDTNIGPILTHGAIEKTNQIMRDQKIAIPETFLVTSKLDLANFKNAIVLAPPSALSTSWVKKFGKTSTGYASGWMAIRGIKRRRAADKGFVISDHADWNGLNLAIKATEAEKIFVTHGYTDSFSKWLQFKGLNASVVKTEFTTTEDDI
ncbi:MAG: ligase-associated DNA damage response exonuclease [Paracoccaceae bacterium]